MKPYQHDNWKLANQLVNGLLLLCLPLLVASADHYPLLHQLALFTLLELLLVRVMLSVTRKKMSPQPQQTTGR